MIWRWDVSELGRCQRWDAALPMVIAATCRNGAIAPQQHCVLPTCSNLRISLVFFKRWDRAALPCAVVATCRSGAIAFQQHRVPFICSNLRVCLVSFKTWDAALPVFECAVAANCHSGAIAQQQHCVIRTCSNHVLSKSLCKYMKELELNILKNQTTI